LGVTVTEKFLQTQVIQAKLQPADEVGIKTKNLNIWCDSSSVWIPDEYIIAASKKMNIFDYLNPERPCYMGCDLSSNVDLTAVSYLMTEGEEDKMRFYFFNEYYLPRETLEKRNIHADIDLYRSWVNNKYIAITAGNVVDYNYILENQKKVNEKSYLRLGYYDKYNATQWAISATDAGINLEPFSQTLANFNGCTKEFERLMLSGRVYIQENPVTKYCLRNVELRRDGNGNVKPDKLKESKKIDGVIAMLQALAAYMADSSSSKGCNIF
jgi:phage terminase large subunit-like protein